MTPKEYVKQQRERERAGLLRVSLPHGAVPARLPEALFARGLIGQMNAPRATITQAVELVLREFVMEALKDAPAS